jgi:hypothetical protein
VSDSSCSSCLEGLERVVRTEEENSTEKAVGVRDRFRKDVEPVEERGMVRGGLRMGVGACAGVAVDEGNNDEGGRAVCEEWEGFIEEMWCGLIALKDGFGVLSSESFDPFFSRADGSKDVFIISCLLFVVSV